MKLSKIIRFNPRYFLIPAATTVWIVFGFIAGYLLGIGQTLEVSKAREAALVKNFQEALATHATPTPTPSQTGTNATAPRLVSYTGPELWDAINKARIEHGVKPLAQKDILCTIAAIRLNQIRDLGKLDNHEGFQSTYDKYKDDPNMPDNVSEFLISGYPTPDQAVEAWLDTLGHKKLITGGEYVWGCVYAQDGFGVAITGY